MKRKRLATMRGLLAGAVIALVVAGCGGGNTPSTHSNTTKSNTSAPQGHKKPKAKTPGY